MGNVLTDPKVIPVADLGQNAPQTDNPLEQFMKLQPNPANDTKVQTVGAGAADWRSQVLDFAKRFVGTPYKWGGNGPLGFDCSGLVQYAYEHIGVNLPRISYQQANYGPRVSLENAQIGDLVAWDLNDSNVGADHIGIFAGWDAKGRPLVLNAPKAGDVVKIQPIWGNPWIVSMNGVK